MIFDLDHFKGINDKSDIRSETISSGCLPAS